MADDGEPTTGDRQEGGAAGDTPAVTADSAAASAATGGAEAPTEGSHSGDVAAASQPASSDFSFAASQAPASNSAEQPAAGASAPADIEKSSQQANQLTDHIDALAELVAHYGKSLPAEQAAHLQSVVSAVGREVSRASSEASGLATLLNDALQQGERLGKENRELRRKQEDAILDKQLKQAQNETEKLRVAGDNYKRELLQQKLSDTEWALSREQDRLKETEADKAALERTVKELKAQFKAGGGEANMSGPLPDMEGDNAPLSSKEREDLAVKITSGEGDRRTIDAQTLVIVAKCLRDTAVLEQHLQQTLQEKERLAQSVEELNDIVFSKTFKAPSAWADRERKYKMEKRDWEIDAKKLADRMEKLRQENKRYRETNRTAEFENAVADLQRQVEAANLAKVAAQQEAHELRMRMRRNDGEFTNDGKRTEYKSPFRSTGSEIDKIDARRPVSAGTPPAVPEEATTPEAAGPITEVKATIKGLEKAGIGHQAPKTPKFMPGRSKISRGGPPAPAPLASPQPSNASAAAGSREWGMAVLEGLEQQGIAPRSPTEPAGQSPDDSGSKPEHGRLLSMSERATAFTGAGAVNGPGSQGRRRSVSDAAAAGDSGVSAMSNPRRDWPQLGGSVSVPNATSPASQSPRAMPAGGSSVSVPASPLRGSIGVEPAAAASAIAPDAAAADASTAAADSTALPDSTAGAPPERTPAGASPTAATPPAVIAAGAAATPGTPGSLMQGTPGEGFHTPLGSEAVWSGIGGDAGARGGAAISTEERENMYRMYSQHVEAEDVGALKWQAAELSSRLEMMQAQLSKANLAADRAQEDKANLEAELASALEAAATPADQSALDAMQGRLADLVERRDAREGEAAKRIKEQEERLKAANTALQNAHREYETMEKRVRRLEKQLAAASAALGPAAIAALEASESGSTASGEDGSGTPRESAKSDEAVKRWGWGDVSGLSEEDLESIRLREENELLMENLVRSKLEMAETQSDYVKTKRALIRAVEKQAEMSEKMDLLKAELELSHGRGGGDSESGGPTLSASKSGSRTPYLSSFLQHLPFSADEAKLSGSPSH